MGCHPLDADNTNIAVGEIDAKIFGNILSNLQTHSTSRELKQVGSDQVLNKEEICWLRQS